MKKLINLIINFIKGLFNVQTLPDNSTESNAPDRSARKRHSAPWWKRVYNLESRDKIPSSNFQIFRGFGNAKAIKPFARPKRYAR